MGTRNLAAWAAAAAALGLAGYTLIDAVRGWNLSDMDAYWDAAMRLRSGEPLYIRSHSVGSADLFRYAPWFAVGWVPLTYLPRPLVTVLWTALLLGATVAAVWPMVRLRRLSAILVAIVLGSFLFWTTSKANVQALLVAALVLGVRSRTGPLWIALAASLKATPLALVAVYLGRRNWAAAAWTLGLTLLLVAPMLLFDLSTYPSNPGFSLALFYLIGPETWLVVAIIAFAVALWLARTRWGWLAAAVAAIAGLPRLLTYDLSLLLVATTDVDERKSPSAGDSTIRNQLRVKTPG